MTSGLAGRQERSPKRPCSGWLFQRPGFGEPPDRPDDSVALFRGPARIGSTQDSSKDTVAMALIRKVVPKGFDSVDKLSPRRQSFGERNA